MDRRHPAGTIEKMKTAFKPGTMIYPLPAVMVSCGDSPDNYNIITIAWTGTICSDPPMCYISVRPQRHSHELISRTSTSPPPPWPDKPTGAE